MVNGADLVCFIGTETGGMTTHFWAVPKIGTPAIQIDIDPEALGRNYPLARRRQRRRQGDARAHARGAPTAPAPASARPGSRRRRAICKEWYGEVQVARSTSDAVPIRPERICAELTRHVPDNAIVVVDTGHAGMWMGGMYDLTSPAQSYMRSAGHLGWAFPAGLGAKCGVPRPAGGHVHRRRRASGTTSPRSRPRRAGASTPSPWSTTTRSGNQSKRGFDRVYGGTQTEQARELWTFSKVNFARIAEDMGALGIRVEKPGDFGPAHRSRRLQANRPVIIDVVTDIDALAPLAVS